MDLPDIGEMSSTHSANPLACVIGKATIEEINKKKLINNSKTKGLFLHRELNKFKKQFPKLVKYIFGKGLLHQLFLIKIILSSEFSC